jgi:hypothetical protein
MAKSIGRAVVGDYAEEVQARIAMIGLEATESVTQQELGTESERIVLDIGLWGASL